MIKKLVRHGNSWALIIDKPLMKLLRLTGKTPLRIETNGRELLVRPGNVSPERERERFRTALRKVMRQHHETLRRLAE